MDKTLTVVSSASRIGYGQYGHRFLASFVENGPPSARLLFYTEGYQIPGVEHHDLLESDWLQEFKIRHEANPNAHGRATGKTGYRFDAVRFAHKVAAIIAADAIATSSHLLWLDADIIVHQPIGEHWLEWVPDPAWLSWLDRSPKAMHYPEGGFLFFNRDHQHHAAALSKLRDWYCTDFIFTFKEWHDSYVWKQLVHNGLLMVRDLSERGYDYPHVLIHSPLGKYFDHCKGPKRKQIGRTPVTELQFARDEDYWRGR